MASATTELQKALQRRRNTIGDASPMVDEWVYEGPAPTGFVANFELAKANAHSLHIHWEGLPKPTPTDDERKRSARIPSGYVYKVEWGYPYWPGWTVVEEEFYAPKCTLTDLKPGTAYCIRVAARFAEAKDKTAFGPYSATSETFTTLTEAESEARKKSKDASTAASRNTAESRMAAEKEQRRVEALANAETETQKLRRELAEAKRQQKLLADLNEQERKRAEVAEARRKKAEEETAAVKQRLTSLNAAKEEVEAAAAAANAREAEARRKAAAVEEQRAAEAAALEAQLQELNAAREEERTRIAAAAAEEATKSAAEVERLQAERKAAEELAAKEMDELRSKLEKLALDREAAAAEAQARAEEEGKRLAEMHVQRQAEAERVAAEMQATLQRMAEDLELMRAEKENASKAAEAAIQAEAARKMEAEELVRWQAERTEQLEAETAQREADMKALQEKIVSTEESMRRAQLMATEASKNAEACTSTIVKQAEENERLRRIAHCKDATIKSLQGAGPNPTLEARLVKAGHLRENIRFFMELVGHTNKSRITSLLERLQQYKTAGYSDAAVREALIVCSNDDDIPAYLESYVKRMAGEDVSDDEGERL